MAPARIVVLTGAGVSAESGLPTFRGAGGLWENHRAEDLATPEAFARDPALVLRFYDERRRKLHEPGVEPNAAHRALAELERRFGGEFLLVTQNVDDLHERAGSRDLLHMHGELMKMRCAHSGTVYPATDRIQADARCACCGLRGSLRPHVVWFGEMPLYMDRIAAALESCELFVAIGTSGSVYPAAGFVRIAASAGARTVEINLEPAVPGGIFSEQRRGPASEQVPRFVEELLSR